MSSLVYQMQNRIDEHRLVDQCLLQNSSAQKALYEKYFPKMMAICMRYFKNNEDAWEVLNTAFLKIFSKLSQYNSEGSLEAWIKKVVINTCLDFIKSKKSYRNKFVLTNEFKSIYTNEDIGAPNTYLNEIGSHLSDEELFELVTELPVASRIVFNMYVIDDFTHKKIADQLNISEGTSKWHLSNARKIMKDKIYQALSKKSNIHGSKG
jgi:RNA polymerase sigma factor (sigma-70 family)